MKCFRGVVDAAPSRLCRHGGALLGLHHTPRRHAGGSSSSNNNKNSNSRSGSHAGPAQHRPRLLSPYGEALHGFGFYLSAGGLHSDEGDASPARAAEAAAAAVYQEPPLEVWLALLSDTVPFHKGDVLILCPSRYTSGQRERLQDAARRHFPQAVVRPIKGSSNSRSSSGASQPTTDTAGAAVEDKSHTSAPDSAGAGVSASLDERALTSTPSPRAPTTTNGRGIEELYDMPLRTPSNASPDSAFDVIVYVSNVLGDELLYQAPLHLSAAYAHLRKPHGVVAITGSTPEWRASLRGPGAGSVAAAAAAGGSDVGKALEEDVRLFQRQVEAEARERLARIDAALPGLAPGDAALDRELRRHRALLRRALDVHETESVAHRDLYLPFPAVRRRYFVSSYGLDHGKVRGAHTHTDDALSGPAALTLLLKQNRLYQVLYHFGGGGGGRELLLEWLRRGPEGAGRRAAEAGGDDFVEEELPQGLVPAPSAEAEVTGVRRRLSAVDPLEGLQYVVESYTAAAAGGGGAGAQQLVVDVTHFVITCSYRGMNADSLELT